MGNAGCSFSVLDCMLEPFAAISVLEALQPRITLISAEVSDPETASLLHLMG